MAWVRLLERRKNAIQSTNIEIRNNPLFFCEIELDCFKITELSTPRTAPLCLGVGMVCKSQILQQTVGCGQQAVRVKNQKCVSWQITIHDDDELHRIEISKGKNPRERMHSTVASRSGPDRVPTKEDKRVTNQSYQPDGILRRWDPLG